MFKHRTTVAQTFMAGAIATAGSLIMAGAARGQATTAPSTTATQTTRPTPEVAALLARLGSDENADRDAAQQALLDVADDATPALRAARLAARDPDVRMRLDTLLSERAERALVGASRITLKLDDAPLGEALKQFSQMTGAQFEDPYAQNNNAPGQPPEPRVTLDLQDATYWQALTTFAESAGVQFQPRGDRVMYVLRGNQGRARTFTGGQVAGPFYVQPINATYSRSVSFVPGGGNGEPNFGVQLLITPEPKLRLSNQSSRVEIRRAVDSNGNDLIGPANQFGSAHGNDQINVSLPLTYPAQNVGNRFAELSGVARLSVATRVASIDLADVLGSLPIERDLGGLRFEVRAPTDADNINRDPNNPAECAFVVTIPRDNAAPNSADRLQQAMNAARLTDVAGNRMQLIRFETNHKGDRIECRIAYTSTNRRRRNDDASPRGPYRWQVDVPVAFRELEVPFTFRDLPMP